MNLKFLQIIYFSNKVTKKEIIKILVNKYKPPGRYEAKWAGTDRFGKQVANGVYLVIMQTRNFSQARKIVYIK